MTKSRVCQICGASWTPGRGQKLTCSRDCRRQLKRQGEKLRKPGYEASRRDDSAASLRMTRGIMSRLPARLAAQLECEPPEWQEYALQNWAKQQ